MLIQSQYTVLVSIFCSIYLARCFALDMDAAVLDPPPLSEAAVEGAFSDIGV